MNKTTKILVGAGVLVALAVVATATVANKGWWARRINNKWVHIRPWTDPETGQVGVETVAPDLTEHNVIQLAGLYFSGSDGWEKREA